MVIPRVVLRPVFALLIDDRSTADDGAEAIGLPFDKSGHFAAIAVAHERELIGVDWVRRNDSIEAGHDVAIVSPAQIILICRCECCTVPGAATRVGPEHRPSLPDQERSHWIEVFEPCAGRTP